MKIEMSDSDIKDLAKRVNEQLTKDVVRDSFRTKINEMVDKKAESYFEMSMTEDVLGDVFYKEIKRFFENNKILVSKHMAEILEVKLKDTAIREFILSKVTESLDDLRMFDREDI